MRLRFEYLEGPLDGHTEVVEGDGLVSDLARGGEQPGRGLHYAMAALPTNCEGLLVVRYRYVDEFDLASDYMQRVEAFRGANSPRSRRPDL